VNHQTIDWAALVFVRGPEGKVVLVLDPEKPTPHFWKFPGGRKEHGETPEKTAVRELEEETGIKVLETDISLISEISKKDHTLFVYQVVIENFNSLAKRGIEGEHTAIFFEKELANMVDFFPPHRKILEQVGMLTS